jgi:hypothetical protein
MLENNFAFSYKAIVTPTKPTSIVQNGLIIFTAALEKS